MEIHSVECPSCKKYFNSELGVCPFCGNIYTEEVQQPTKSRPERRKKSRRTAIIVGVVAAAILVSVISIVAIKSSFFGILKQRGMETSSDDPVDSHELSSDAAITQHANLTNWGFACEIEGEMYYSDWETGIYIDKQSGAEKFITGCYSDLCLLDGKLFCVEYYKQYGQDDMSGYYQLVMIDVKTKDMKEIFEAPTDSDMIALCNCVNGKIYFTVDNDLLYTVDKAGKVTNTGIRNVRGVTNTGIYTTRYAEKGLVLRSFNNEEKRVFSALDSYEVWIKLELNDVLYLGLSPDESEDEKTVKFDMKNGMMTDFPYQNKYGVLKYMNYFDGKIYMTFDKNGRSYICRTGVDDASISVITPDHGFGYGVISIAAGKMCVSFPFSVEEPQILVIVENPIVSVQKYDDMINMGVCCEMKNAPVEIQDHLTYYQKSIFFDLQEITCCNTIEEVKRHVDRYVDSALQSGFDENLLLEYEGRLYIVLGAKGYISHDYKNYQVIDDSDGRIVVKVTEYDSGDNPNGSDEFIMEKTEKNYRVIEVKKK